MKKTLFGLVALVLVALAGSCPVKRWKFDQRHLHRVNVQFDPESTLDEKPACVHA
jgi:hypothetical protein